MFCYVTSQTLHKVFAFGNFFCNTRFRPYFVFSLHKQRDTEVLVVFRICPRVVITLDFMTVTRSVVLLHYEGVRQCFILSVCNPTQDTRARSCLCMCSGRLC